MFESQCQATALLERVRSLRAGFADVDFYGEPSTMLIALLTELEQLKCAAEGAQVMAAAALEVDQRAEQRASGVPAVRLGQGVGLQVGLARRESHHRGAQHLGLARVLVLEMPCTLKALRAGRISEWRATIVARETACLSRENRETVDARLGSSVESLGECSLVAEVKRLTYALDPQSVVARRRKAEGDRSVSIRPAPDCMTYLTALLPVSVGVSAYAALSKTSDTMRSEGDPRSRGQVMADLLVTRVLGQADGQRPRVSVTLNIVVSDQVLVGSVDGAAELDGYGPVPASLVRELASAPSDVQAAVRRLYARPGAGTLVAMDSVARYFPTGLATFIRLRDRTCRTPWCDAPIRHIDHITSHVDGGPTSADNGQGLCQACNHAKQAPGWQQTVEDPLQHRVKTTTPTGAKYHSTAPPCPEPAMPARRSAGRSTGRSTGRNTGRSTGQGSGRRPGSSHSVSSRPRIDVTYPHIPIELAPHAH